VRQPAFLLAQPRQGGAGQGVEGLVAGRAAVAAEAAGIAPALQCSRGTVRTARCGEERFLEQPYRLALARRRRQGPPERRPLLQAEPLDQVQQRREIDLAHHPPHRQPSTGSLGLNSQREKSLQKSFAELVREALPERARGKPVEIWFQDEARVGQQGTLTRVGARRGTRPRAPRDRRHAWAYLFGAVCP